MAQPGQLTTLQERVQIRDLAAAGYSDPEIAARLNRPLATIRKWRRIAQRHSRPDLTSRFGRRSRGALSTFPPSCRATFAPCAKPTAAGEPIPSSSNSSAIPAGGSSACPRQRALPPSSRQRA